MTRSCEHYATVLHRLFFFGQFDALSFACLILVEKKKETITESAGRQQKKKIGKKPVNRTCVRKKTEIKDEKSQVCFALMISLSVR